MRSFCCGAGQDGGQQNCGVMLFTHFLPQKSTLLRILCSVTKLDNFTPSFSQLSALPAERLSPGGRAPDRRQANTTRLQRAMLRGIDDAHLAFGEHERERAKRGEVAFAFALSPTPRREISLPFAFSLKVQPASPRATMTNDIHSRSVLTSMHAVGTRVINHSLVRRSAAAEGERRNAKTVLSD